MKENQTTGETMIVLQGGTDTKFNGVNKDFASKQDKEKDIYVGGTEKTPLVATKMSCSLNKTGLNPDGKTYGTAPDNPGSVDGTSWIDEAEGYLIPEE